MKIKNFFKHLKTNGFWCPKIPEEFLGLLNLGGKFKNA